jgi:hypothetical protein
MPNKFIALILTALLTLAALPVTRVYASPFGDTIDHPSRHAVEYAAGHGYLYLDGESASAFPDSYITRGEWAYTLDKWLEYLAPLMTGIGYAPVLTEVTFDDILGHQFYDSIYYLAERGITEEWAAAFRPDDLISRQEICEYFSKLMPQWKIGPDYSLDVETILARYTDSPDFLRWYQWAIAFMTESGLMSFYELQDFMPQYAFTRAEMCELLLKAEGMLRGRVRDERLSGQSVASSQITLDHMDVNNITLNAVNVEVAVNEAARAVNPHVILAYTTDPDLIPTAENVLSSQFKTQSQRLTQLRRVDVLPDEITYSLRLRGTPGETYYLYAVLKDGGYYSNFVKYVVTMAGAF